MNIKKSLVFLLVSVMILVTMGLSIPTAGAVTIPTHVITGYWQNFNNGATCLKLASVPTSYGIIAVAFADATGTPGAVSFTLDSGLASALGGYTDAQFKADIATVHGRGQRVIISVGGQNGAISVSDSTSATNFANSIHSLMSNYGFDGVDIDLENGVSPTYMAQALNNLSGQNPGLIIAMAPETIYMQSASSTYLDLCLRVKSILTVVNTQYYNSGSMLGYNGQVYSQGTEDFMTALATIPLENGLAPGQVGLGLPASTSGAGSGYVAPSLVNAALDCLYNGTNAGSYHPPHTYPGIRGAMTWSINWDASNGYNWVNTIYPHLSSLGGGSTPTPTPAATATPTPAATPTATPVGQTPTPTPTATPTPVATATPTPGGIAAWAPNTAYSVNQLCTYGGSTYSCRQAHTSIVTWEPPNVPALWLLQ